MWTLLPNLFFQAANSYLPTLQDTLSPSIQKRRALGSLRRGRSLSTMPLWSVSCHLMFRRQDWFMSNESGGICSMIYHTRLKYISTILYMHLALKHRVSLVLSVDLVHLQLWMSELVPLYMYQYSLHWYLLSFLMASLGVYPDFRLKPADTEMTVRLEDVEEAMTNASAAMYWAGMISALHWWSSYLIWEYLRNFCSAQSVQGALWQWFFTNEHCRASIPTRRETIPSTSSNDHVTGQRLKPSSESPCTSMTKEYTIFIADHKGPLQLNLIPVGVASQFLSDSASVAHHCCQACCWILYKSSFASLVIPPDSSE